MPQKQPHIRFIVNPTSGPRSNENVVNRIEEFLNHEKYSHDIVFTEYAGHAPDLARQAAQEGCAVVVAVGGDGTMNEVARGLLYSDTALALLPKGSGNGLARHLLVPMGLKGALEVINGGHITSIDSGSINGHPFFTAGGIGFDAYISSVFAGNKKRGLKTYVELVLKEVLHYNHLPVSIRINGKTIDTDCYVLAIANAAQYGNNAYIAPFADIRDGLFDVCLVRKLDVIKALNLSYSMLTKQKASPDTAEYFTTDKLEVSTAHKIMFHADGEYLGEASAFTIEMLPQSLKVVTPAKLP